MKLSNIILLTLVAVLIIGGSAYVSQDWSVSPAPVVVPVRPVTPPLVQPLPPVVTSPQKYGGTAVLRVGETKQLEGVSVKLMSVDQDSRCPEVANCVWAGEVVATFTTVSSGTSRTVVLKTNNVPVWVGDSYSLLLTRVQPPKVLAQEIKSTDYRLTVKVEGNKE